MKRLFIATLVVVAFESCKKENKKVDNATSNITTPIAVAPPSERVEIADAKNKLAAAETQTRLGNLEETQYTEVIALLTKGIEKNPNAADAYALRAWANFRLNKNSTALQDFNKALAIDPKTVPALTGRGSLYEVEGKLTDALADYNMAISILPSDAATFNNRGSLKRKMNMTDGAIADFTQAISISSSETMFYINRGNAFVEAKRYEDAKNDYEKAIALNRQFAPAYAGRANIHYQLGDYKNAIVDYDMAIKLQPNNADTWRNRGYNKFKLGQSEAALTDINKALALKNDDKLAIQFKEEVASKKNNM